MGVASVAWVMRCGAPAWRGVVGVVGGLVVVGARRRPVGWWWWKATRLDLAARHGPKAPMAVVVRWVWPPARRHALGGLLARREMSGKHRVPLTTPGRAALGEMARKHRVRPRRRQW